MIIQQCNSCSKKGKNVYCNNCNKEADYFDIYKYYGDNNRFDKGESVGRIKAYTWHDAIEYIKNNLFHNRSNNLNINCEKDFGYLEEKTEPYIIENDTKEESLGYKIHLNKKGSESESFSLRDENFWDLTIAPITNSNNSGDVAHT
jgi:hypothetical protein